MVCGLCIFCEFLEVILDLWLHRWASPCGSVVSKRGRGCRLHATTIAVLIWAVAHIKMISIPHVSSLGYTRLASELTCRTPRDTLLVLLAAVEEQGWMCLSAQHSKSKYGRHCQLVGYARP